MDVIVNATPLINFASINRLDILKSLFGKIIVPSRVWNEVVTKASEYDTSEVIKSADFITIKKAKDEILYKTLLMDINKGEAEAIVLTLETKASLVILDEKEARDFAEYYGLNFTGTVGCLLKAKQKGIIENLKTVLDDIVIKGNFWLSDDVYNKVLELAKEK